MADDGIHDKRLARKVYEAELFRLQGELVLMQEWVRQHAVRLVVVFEGRDAAGKGSAIKRVTEFLNSRVARIAALPAPTERERTQWYFQRYVEQLPAAGEIVLFDRSWYNRAGVEWVMGFCSKQEHQRFLHQCPIFERLLVEDGILLRKYWFSVSDAEQERRFASRLSDPMRRWKLSPMDFESISRWEDYSRAKDEMFVHTDLPEAPWYVVGGRRQAPGADQHDRSPAVDGPLRRGAATAVGPARPAAVEGIRADAAGNADLRPRPRGNPDAERREASEAGPYGRGLTASQGTASRAGGGGLRRERVRGQATEARGWDRARRRASARSDSFGRIGSR